MGSDAAEAFGKLLMYGLFALIGLFMVGGLAVGLMIAAYEDGHYGREQVDEEFERRFAAAFTSTFMMPSDTAYMDDILRSFARIRFTGFCIFTSGDVTQYQWSVDREIRLPDPRPIAGDSPAPLPFVDSSSAPLVFLWNNDEYKFVRLDHAIRQMADRGERPPIRYRFHDEESHRCHRLAERPLLHATRITWARLDGIARHQILNIRLGSVREVEDVP
jgi:hypothetical protein